MVAMFVNRSGRNEKSLQRTFHRCFLPSFGSFGQKFPEEKIFQKSTNQKQELLVVAMIVNGSGQNKQYLQRTFHRCYLQSFISFGYSVSEEKTFRNKNRQWQPCLLTNWDNMSNLHRGPSMDTSYQVLVHLAKRFQRTIFKN